MQPRKFSTVIISTHTVFSLLRKVPYVQRVCVCSLRICYAKIITSRRARYSTILHTCIVYTSNICACTSVQNCALLLVIMRVHGLVSIHSSLVSQWQPTCICRKHPELLHLQPDHRQVFQGQGQLHLPVHGLKVSWLPCFVFVCWFWELFSITYIPYPVMYNLYSIIV